jgi:hypothetical protein
VSTVTILPRMAQEPFCVKGAILCKIVTVGIKVMTKVRFLHEVVTYIYIQRERERERENRGDNMY